MSTTISPPPAPVEDAQATRARRLRRRAASDGAVARPLRFAAFAALVVYGCLHWVRQVAPTENGTALRMAAVAVVLAALLPTAGRLPRGRARAVGVAVLCLLAAVAALATAGVPLRYLGWRNWGDFTSGIGGGISALPNLNIPYRGLDEWVRWIIASGAALLGVLAAALAFAPAWAERRHRHAAAAVVLCVLYGVPIVERNPESPFLSGAGFAVLLALFLGADRLAAVGGARPRLLAAGAGAGALALAALAAPQLDGDRPWIDYRGLAGDLGERNQTAFNWNHSYSPLDWPRDGREVLRVRAKEPAYWKASVLRRFDGVRWVRDEPVDLREAELVDTPRPVDEPEWYGQIDVTVRNLRSEEYVTAGYAEGISEIPRPPRPSGSGTYRTAGRPLRPGDTYKAAVYTPRPNPRELREAGTTYPSYVIPDLTMELPRSVGGPDGGRQSTGILFSSFGSTDAPQAYVPGSPATVDAGPLLARSGYRRTWEAAQALRNAATSPFDLVRRVRLRVQEGTRYTERPEQRPIPLDAFLFDTKAGYCQQFSGAMALMLRMAGVPARVASGFTPGSFDSDRGQYVVRDLDAHSWVEAYFPDIGWVTFDPTPTIAPPASQDTGDGGDAASDSGTDDATARADVPEPEAPAPAPEAESTATAQDGSSPVLPVLLGLLALGLVALGAWLWRRPRTALSPLDELGRALARSGRPPAPGLTLQALERSLGGTPAAQDYVRKLRMARYAGAEEAPSRQERAALRDELAAGLGLTGRLRAWWALPPRLQRR